MYHKIILTLGVVLGLLGCEPQEVEETSRLEIEPYEANWTSLQRHKTPQWMKDAKFGIYSHWGAQSVKLALNQKDMSDKRAIELWSGAKFNAKEWVELYQRAGAQFAGPVAWHVNGCLNWDSQITDWNSAKKGPKIDIYGELAKEIRRTDMKLMASFHSTALWGKMSKADNTHLDPDGDYSKTGRTSRVHGAEGRYTEAYMQGWLERMKEGFELYQPDMVWVDVGFGGTLQMEKRHLLELGKRTQTEKEYIVDCIPEHIQMDYLSSYFNAAQIWGKEVSFAYKSFDIPPGIAMRDIENGNLDGLQYDPWMADINMQQHIKWPTVWFYNPENTIKGADILVDMIVDIASKNGRVLLNVPPKADGSFAENIKEELYKIGDWLMLNGEAIYGSSPWFFYGEGPAYIKNPGHHGQGKKRGEEIPIYGLEDIRFTQKNGFLYAILLDWPGEEVSIKSLGYMGKLHPRDIKNVTMIGSKEELTWEQNAYNLTVKLPKVKPCDFAYVLKIQRK
ncbi:alpha-L-fucosidase [Reichenbachiella versicolor]|uniref:alpha-L-fucosidase n=1 Tax=Reichenbachiella versicolor TaxID=1821036 RepID=UPI000D6E0B99|nr:alpha-L-fucosidase [Reichenbachiella versicolor]